jgi:DinB superfamily
MSVSTAKTKPMDWVRAIAVDQLGFYWDYSLWPRLQGLTDDEYFWEPVAGAWSVRRTAEGILDMDGRDAQEPDPPPVTTIAWRLTHIAVDVFATRADTFFGENAGSGDMFDERRRPPLPGSAAAALALLESSYHQWRDGLLSLDEKTFLEPLGPRGAFFADQPMAALALHLNRETMHHGGEIGLLRDLYRATGAHSRADRLAIGGG